MNAIFKIFVVLAIIGSFCLPVSVQAQSEKLEQVLDQEFEWLKEEAEAVTVSIATRTEMTLNEAPSIVSVITAEEIRNSGAKRLEEVLRQVVGFYVYSHGTFPEINVGIRGPGTVANPGIKVMINGHSMENAINDNDDVIPSFPLDLIKRIEIIRGPGSALYGNEAMNGVINIITKDGKDPSSVSVAYGSFDMYKGTASLSYAKDDLNLFFFGDTFSGDGDPQFIEKDSAAPGFSYAPGYTNEEFRWDTLFTRLSYKGFWLTGYYNKDRGENPVGVTGALTDENDVRFEKIFAEAGYETSLNEKVKLTAKAYYDHIIDDFDYEMFSEETAPMFNGIMDDNKLDEIFRFPNGESPFMGVESETDKFGAEIMTEISPADSLDIVAGLVYERFTAEPTTNLTNTNFTGQNIIVEGTEYPGMVNNRPVFSYLGYIRTDPYATLDEKTRTIYAGYIQGTWDIMKAFPSLEKIGKNLTLTAGLRYDKYDDVGDTLNPRMGLVYAPNEKFFFKLLYGEAFRAPTFGQLGIKNTGTVFGNPNLEPETIKTTEFLTGINLAEHITATLNFFQIKKEDNIVRYLRRYENWGKIESRGAEGEIRVSYDKNKYGYFNITFQKVEDLSHETITDTGGAEYVQKDFNIGMYPEIMANMGVNWNFNKYISANVSVNYIGSVERIGNMQFTSDPDDPDGTVEKVDSREPLDSYTLVNLSLRFGNFNFVPGLEFQITGYNIFDADHRDPEAEGSVENDIPRWDRHFMGKLTYTF